MKRPSFDFAVYEKDEWLVNGNPAQADVGDYLDHTIHELDQCTPRACPQCGGQLTIKRFDDFDEEGRLEWHFDRTFIYRRCPNCAYWDFNGTEGGNKCMDTTSTFLLNGIVRRFAEWLPDGCSQETAQFLRRHPSYWHEMAPRQLEKLVADIFKANYHDAEVIHVGRPYDGGVDVVFVEANGTRWLIQVKRRAKPAPCEGFSTLQSILGTLVLEGACHGMVVSTADAFSFHARKGCNRAKEEGFIIELVDKGRLDRMITPLLPATPWKDIFETPGLSAIADDVRSHFLHNTGGGDNFLTE